MRVWRNLLSPTFAPFGGSLLPRPRNSRADSPPSYTETPKYRCPRCRTQTCSLPCYKRHQQRASCNGKRDPAAYLKKSQLATPASIDRDYNYLKSVERGIDDASADARERGVDGHRHPQRGGHEREGAFRRYLAENGIKVEYAPKGMSRQKSNQSRVTKQRQVFWTIEWMDESGERNLRHHAPASESLRELHRGVQLAKRKRKNASEGRDEGPSRASKKAKVSFPSTPAGDGELDTKPTAITRKPSADPATAAAPQLAIGEEENPITTDYFYLLQPSTASPSRVLIPVNPDATLTQTLSGQTIQEYPTIYVLNRVPWNLPAGFVPHQKYQDMQNAVRAHLADEAREHDAKLSAASKHTKRAGSGEQLDANAILDMLKRDVRA